MDEAMDVPARPSEAKAEQAAREQTVLHLCKLLLDEERLQILGLLAHETLGVEELVARLPIKAAAIARHLQQLTAGGLVRAESANGAELYRLDVPAVQGLKKQLFAREVDATAQTPTGKILASFVKANRLTHLPTHPLKLRVVLGWLAGCFHRDEAYPERAVNELLGGHDVDYATLRRLLVDHGLLTRQAGIYRRVKGAEEL